MTSKAVRVVAGELCKIETGANFDDLADTNGEDNVDFRQDYLQRAQRLVDAMEAAGLTLVIQKA